MKIVPENNRSLKDIFQNLAERNYRCPKCGAIYPAAWLEVRGRALNDIVIKFKPSDRIKIFRSYRCLDCDTAVDSFEIINEGLKSPMYLPGFADKAM